jgi:hypothetical protein
MNLHYTGRYTFAISAVNTIWYVLNRKTMEYKYCSIVGPTRSISFKHILLRERHEPSNTTEVCDTVGILTNRVTW